jgi:hypothetical protein
MRTTIIGVSLVLVLLTGPAWGEDTANEVLPGCRAFLKPPESGWLPAFKQGICVGTIEGVIGAGIMDAVRGGGTDPFCIPDGVTRGQLVRVVVNFADQHPELTHAGFSSFASAALALAWPCRP